MLGNFQDVSANMSIKVHFLNTHHLDRFSKNCGDIGDEQGERFDEGIDIMGKQYQVRWNTKTIKESAINYHISYISSNMHGLKKG